MKPQKTNSAISTDDEDPACLYIHLHSTASGLKIRPVLLPINVLPTQLYNLPIDTLLERLPHWLSKNASKIIPFLQDVNGGISAVNLSASMGSLLGRIGSHPAQLLQHFSDLIAGGCQFFWGDEWIHLPTLDVEQVVQIRPLLNTLQTEIVFNTAWEIAHYVMQPADWFVISDQIWLVTASGLFPVRLTADLPHDRPAPDFSHFWPLANGRVVYSPLRADPMPQLVQVGTSFQLQFQYGDIVVPYSRSYPQQTAYFTEQGGGWLIERQSEQERAYFEGCRQVGLKMIGRDGTFQLRKGVSGLDVGGTAYTIVARPFN